jgi:hypothetical protein
MRGYLRIKAGTWYNCVLLKRTGTYITIALIVALMGLATAYAASGGHIKASNAVYQAEGSTGTLTVEGDVTFDYSGYHFSAESADISIDRPEDEDIETDLKSAVFSGGVSVTTPTGGRVSSPKISVTRSGQIYNFTGSITYTEGDLTVRCSGIRFDKASDAFTATGDVEATYRSMRGIKGEDGQEHPVVYRSSGLVYQRNDGILKNIANASTSIMFDGLTFTSDDIKLTLTDAGLIGVVAAGDISVEGKGITVSGINGDYDASTGELRVWGDVKYSRGSDNLSASEVTWYVAEDVNRVTVKGGAATVDIGEDDEGRDDTAEG